MPTTYARLINQYIFTHHIKFSASFYTLDGERQRSDEIDFFLKLNINRNLSESDINNIDVKSQ